MKVTIEGTNEVKKLSIIDPKTGVDYIADFIGNTGALGDQFDWDEEEGYWSCSQSTYNWWSRVVEDHQRLADRIAELEERYGFDRVHEVTQEVGIVDLDDSAAIDHALDAAFGS